MAWDIARTTLINNPKGVGWNQFEARFVFWRQEISKSTHSAYVRVGAELGYYGLFLYLGVIYCSLRTLFQIRPETEDAERSRRLLFILLLAYMGSNWMINRAYHTEYFLIAAVCAAYYRLHGFKRTLQEEEAEEAVLNAEGEWTPARGMFTSPVRTLTPAMSSGSAGAPLSVGRAADLAEGISRQPLRSWGKEDKGGTVSVSGSAKPQDDEESTNKQLWRGIGIIDLCLIGIMLRTTLFLWDYILKNL